jgi:hypothetical protein
MHKISAIARYTHNQNNNKICQNRQASVQKLKMNSAIHTEKNKNQHKQAGTWNKTYTLVHRVATTHTHIHRKSATKPIHRHRMTATA